MYSIRSYTRNQSFLAVFDDYIAQNTGSNTRKGKLHHLTMTVELQSTRCLEGPIAFASSEGDSDERRALQEPV